MAVRLVHITTKTSSHSLRCNPNQDAKLSKWMTFNRSSEVFKIRPIRFRARKQKHTRWTHSAATAMVDPFLSYFLFFICLIVCACVYVNACLRDGNSLFLVPCAFPLIRDQQHRRVRSLDFWPPRWSLLSHYYFYDYYYCYYYHYSIGKHNKEKMKIIIHFRHLDSRDTAVMLQTRGHECVNEHEKTVSRPGRCDCLPKK